MFNESTIYGKNGLFDQIVAKSKVFNGRYALLPKNGQDLNTNNILSGVDFPDTKQPGVFLVPPHSYIKGTTQQAEWEYFVFRMFFLCTTGYSGDNQMKNRDTQTNTSLTKIEEEWSHMKYLALNFMFALESLQKMPDLRGQFRLSQKEEWRIVRVTNLKNDRLSGVMLTFEACIAAPCEFDDIAIDQIEMPIDHYVERFH